MKDKYVLYKNKDEKFSCQLQINGASSDNSFARLCLEFDDNKNLFFYGRMDEGGNCVIEIPKLKEFDNKKGKLSIEVVADDTYFRLFEAEVELKNSVEVRMVNKTEPAKPLQNEIKIVGLVHETKRPVEEVVEKTVEKGIEPAHVEERRNPFIVNKPKVRR